MDDDVIKKAFVVTHNYYNDASEVIYVGSDKAVAFDALLAFVQKISSGEFKLVEEK